MVLKHRPWRTTEVERGPETVFVKRFHDARLPILGFSRWRDRRRARGEARRLGELARAGVAVPAVLGIRETAAGVELRLEYLHAAQTLEQRAESGFGPASNRLARALGELLAGLHGAGFAHGDLHLGNVLVDGSERAWLVDAAAIRRGSPSARAHDLVHAAAALRERSSARFRARCWLAYVRASTDARRAEAASLSEAIEGAARTARRERVRAERDRWLRESGVCARHVDGNLRVLAVRNLSRAEALLLARSESMTVPITAPTTGHATVRVHGRSARDAWTDAARLVEHRIPTALPLAFVESPRAAAVFGAPLGAREPVRDSTADALALGTLAGALWDRGLRLDRCDVAVDERGEAFMRAGAGIRAATRLEIALEPWRRLRPAANETAITTDWAARAEFVQGFLEAQRGSRMQREQLRELLRDLLASATGPSATHDLEPRPPAPSATQRRTP